MSDKHIVRRLVVACSLLLAAITVSAATVYITPPQNGNAVCPNPDGWTKLDPIMITEGADNADRNAIVKNQTGVTLILTCPSGFYFKPGAGGLALYGDDVHTGSVVIDSSTITVTFSTYNSTTVGDKIKIQGIKVKATTAGAGATGDIMRLAADPGTANIDGIVNGTTSFASLTQADSMTYTSSTTTQVTSNTTASATDQAVLAIQIVMTDGCDGLDVTGFALNVTGSSNAANDIDRSKIYYTGTSPYFDTTEQFGTQSAPTTGYTMAGNQQLVEGTNYFWLTYDIAAGATNGNVVDAICTNITIDGSGETPTVTAPSGSRTIGITGITSNGTGGGDWDDTLSWASNVVPTLNDDVVILTDDTINMTADHAAIDITVQTDGQLNIGSNELTIYGDFDVSGEVNSDSGTELIIADFGFMGQLEIPSGVATLKKLTLDRGEGAWSDHNIDLDDNVPADSVVLVLDRGILMMNDSSDGSGDATAVLLNSYAIERYIEIEDDRHVDGKISRWIYNDGTWWFFPCGDEGRGRYMALMANSVTGNNLNTCKFNWFTHFDINNYNAAQLPGGVNDKYYWTHVRVSSQNVARRFYYKDSDFGASVDINDVVIANYTSTWSEATTPTTYNTTAKYLAQGSPNASNDTDWTWGSLLAPGFLYVDLAYFNAEVNEQDEVLLQWGTFAEFNNDYYIIERSTDGKYFYPIGSVKGAGNSNIYNTYEFIDESPLLGLSYYRLKQVDRTGEVAYLPSVAVRIEARGLAVIMAPNPVIDRAWIRIDSKYEREIHVRITDIVGNVVYEEDRLVDRLDVINLDMDEYKEGIYFIHISDQFENIYFNKFIKL